MKRPKDNDGTDIIMGKWYWARSRTGKLIGAGMFSVPIGGGECMFWMNGTGYDPKDFRFYMAFDVPPEDNAAIIAHRNLTANLSKDLDEKDWRIGLTVKPKMRNHDSYYERGIVEAVLPDGTGGVFDPHGVLRIKLSRGTVTLVRSDDWVTA